MTETRVKLVLASASPRRLALLEQVGIRPDLLMPADIDETPMKRETPRRLAIRLAAEKARTGKLSHHLPHLDVLLDELIDLGDVCSRSTRDAPPSVRIQDAVIVALFPRHRVDDRLGAFELLLHLLRLLFVKLRHSESTQKLIREHFHDL